MNLQLEKNCKLFLTLALVVFKLYKTEETGHLSCLKSPYSVAFILEPYRNPKPKHQVLCKKQIRNSSSSTCINFFCSNGYKKNDTKCSKSKMAKVFVTRSREKNVNFNTCLLSRNYAMYVELNVDNIIGCGGTYFNKLGESYNITKTKAINFAEVHTEKFNLRQVMTDVENLVSDAQTKAFFLVSTRTQYTKSHGFDVTRTFPNTSICAQPVELIYDPNSMMFNLDCTAITINKTEYTFVAFIVQQGESIMQKISICKQFYHTVQQNCPLRLLTKNYSIQNNGSMYYLTKLFQLEEYLPVQNGVGVCINLSKFVKIPYKWRFIMDSIEHYITLFGLPVGICCYVWLLFVFISCKKLHNMSGFNTSALCFSLLIADTFFLLVHVQQSKQLCQTTAIVLHWSLILSYVWTVLITFEIALSLRSPIAILQVGRRGKRRFFIYCIIAVCLSATAIFVPMLLSKLKIVDFNYGGEKGVCWIQSYDATIYGFIVPVAVLALTTVLLFTYTIFAIRQETKRNRIAQSNRKIDVSKLATKLILTLGIVECLGFIRITKTNLSELEEISNAIFHFIFTTTRSMRGLCLWGVLIRSKNINKIHREWFRSKISSRVTRRGLELQDISTISVSGSVTVTL